MSVDETAQCLGIPEATVRSRHFRAKSMLRESLARDIDLAERDVFEFGGDDCDRVVGGGAVASEERPGPGAVARIRHRIWRLVIARHVGRCWNLVQWYV
jgi:RNA polymerase sigma-70 factor (ECF subfamily)